VSTTTPRVAIGAADHPIVPNLEGARHQLWRSVPMQRVSRDEHGKLEDLISLRMSCDLCQRMTLVESLTVLYSGHAICPHCHEMHRTGDVRDLFACLRIVQQINDIVADDVPF